MEKTGKKSKAKRERRERRFLPRSTTSPLAVRVAGGLGAAALGAGTWAQVGRGLVGVHHAAGSLTGAADAAQPLPYAPWIRAGGAVLLGVSIWFGTSGDPPVLVGDAGVGIDKGGLRRMAWHQVESVTFDGSTRAIVARGKDDAGAELVVRCPVGSQPQAAAWLLKEARARVPAVVDVAEDAVRDVPAARDDAGESIALDALQVVGKRCADSGEIIAYEPDARVCRRCERVYHKAHVPTACACGASLASLQARARTPASSAG
jgi:hypothetical protein